MAGVVVPACPSLRGVGLEIYSEICNPNDAIQWAMRHGLLAGSRVCSRCTGNVPLTLENCRVCILTNYL